MNVLVRAAVVMAMALPIAASDTDVRPSLRFSCLNDRFLSIAASTAGRDQFPAVRLVLTDPNGRETGFEVGQGQIPKSRYGRVIEIPAHPDYSRAIAAEVCSAGQGRYQVTVEEQADARYRLTITGDGDASTNSKPLHLLAQKGRKRRYLFNYFVSEGKALIEILAESGKPMTFPDRVALDEW